MQLDRGIVKIGMEIEVAAWKPNFSFYKVAKKLVEEKYMIGPENQWKEYHTYHCSCQEGGCYNVRRGDLMVPPLTVVTYDGSLPKEGAEFIISPVLLETYGMPDLQAIWDIVTEGAIWTLDLIDIYDRPASPSIHLHISAVAEGIKKQASPISLAQSDIFHALSMLTPEFFAIADLAGVRRGVKYRLPTREAVAMDEKGAHHGFIQVRKANPGKEMYLEWRLFEAAYQNWQYVETCAYLAAAITRGLLQENTLNALMSAGYSFPYDQSVMAKAVEANNTDYILSQLNKHRIMALREICFNQIDDDAYAMGLMHNMFDRLEGMV